MKKAFYKGRFIKLNKNFMVIGKNSLIKNKFNKNYYFNPNYPFRNNDTEWFNRFIKKGGESYIISQSFVSELNEDL